MAKNKPKSAATQKPAAQSKAGTTTKAASASLPAAEVKRTADTMEKPSKKTALRESILARKAATKPIAFSLDEVRAIAKTNASKAVEVPAKPAKGALKDSKTKPGAGKPIAAKQPLALEKPAKPNHIKAASLADILGFNPKKAKSVEVIEEGSVPEKYKRYYRILVDMRAQLTEGIERHSEESLKRSAKDDAGDLSAYGQNMADGGINTFDRDFVLSLVSNEQEALSEIESAIKRIRDGTYGICEVTGKQIAKERLLAVPFTRYSTEAQKEIEKNRYRSRAQSDLFGEMGEEGAKLVEDDAGGEE
jgi:RNA polymerase-binding transcription factor DksA